MRAVICRSYGTPEDLVIEEVADPVPGPGQVVVRVRAAAVNPTDTVLRSGGRAERLRDVSPPHVPGMDAAEYAQYRSVELRDNPHTRLINMTKSEMAETLDQLADGLDEALDPELSREELVAKVKELSDIASGEEEEEFEEEEEEELD